VAFVVGVWVMDNQKQPFFGPPRAFLAFGAFILVIVAFQFALSDQFRENIWAMLGY